MILVHTADAPEAAYRKVARLFTASGYGLQSSDATLRTITTTFKQVGHVGPAQLTAVVLDDSAGSVVQLTGVYKWTAAEVLYRGAGDEPERIRYGGASGSAAKRTWQELYAIAASYPGGQLEYRVAP